jgi:3',5'-cyclic AMP phosphodiesterase CpdA
VDPAEADAPILRFGVIADPQYARLAPANNRYYEASRRKLEQAVGFFNLHEDLHFVVTLGDLIDRNWESFDDVLPVYAKLHAPPRWVLGNHDFLVGEGRVGDVPGRLGLSRAHYDFGAAGHRFIVVDGTEISLFANRPGGPNHQLAEERLAAMIAGEEPNAREWNGGMSEAQFGWLEATLQRAADAGERVIIFGHFPVHPFGEHAMWEAGRFTQVLGRFPNVLAYFNGHDHKGNYASLGGTHVVNFRGMVEGETDNAYARVDVYLDRIEIVGQGVELSRVLAL